MHFAKSISDTLGIETYTPMLDESVVLGSKVSRAAIVTQRTAAPFTEPMIPMPIPTDLSLDVFEKKLESRIEECRNELKSAKSENERSSILYRYKMLLQKETDEMLTRIH